MSSANSPVLQGQRALVTGASSGIGTAIAKALAAAGAKVVVNYAGGADRAQAVVEQIKAGGGEALAIGANVSREDEVEAMFARMIAAWVTGATLYVDGGMTLYPGFEDGG